MVVELKLRLGTRIPLFGGIFVHKDKVYRLQTSEYATTDSGVEYIRVTAEELDVATLSDVDKNYVFYLKTTEHKRTNGFVPATM